MNIKEIELLASLMKQNDLTLLTVEEGELKIKLERSCSTMVAAPVAVAPVASPTPTPAVAVAQEEDCTVVDSPMIGVFYATPTPDSQPFVSIGSQVQRGDVLCILEAMKLMNEVVAEVDGVVADICLKTGEVAEFGQPLFKIRRS